MPRFWLKDAWFADVSVSIGMISEPALKLTGLAAWLEMTDVASAVTAAATTTTAAAAARHRLARRRANRRWVDGLRSPHDASPG